MFDILRMEINGLIAHGLIVFETMIYEGIPDLDTSGRESPTLIPNRQWANIHWPSVAVSAVSELYRVAMLAKGLSGRKLKGLVAHAQYKYLVDEPGDLRDLLIALEAVVRKKTRQPAVSMEQETATARHSPTRVDGPVDMAKFLSDLEADHGDGDSASG